MKPAVLILFLNTIVGLETLAVEQQQDFETYTDGYNLCPAQGGSIPDPYGWWRWDNLPLGSRCSSSCGVSSDITRVISQAAKDSQLGVRMHFGTGDSGDYSLELAIGSINPSDRLWIAFWAKFHHNYTSSVGAHKWIYLNPGGPNNIVAKVSPASDAARIYYVTNSSETYNNIGVTGLNDDQWHWWAFYFERDSYDTGSAGGRFRVWVDNQNVVDATPSGMDEAAWDWIELFSNYSTSASNSGCGFNDFDHFIFASSHTDPSIDTDSSGRYTILSPASSGCVDNDGDSYGTGNCLGPDCDDTDISIHQTIRCAYDGHSCGTHDLCQASCPTPPAENCSQSGDEDCDSFADCADSDCLALDICGDAGMADAATAVDATVDASSGTPDDAGPLFDGGQPDVTYDVAAQDGVTADTFAADAFVADTLVADALVADTFVADTLVADAFVTDTLVADALVAVADTLVADTLVADISADDVLQADAFSTPDSTAADGETRDNDTSLGDEQGCSCSSKKSGYPIGLALFSLLWRRKF